MRPWLLAMVHASPYDRAKHSKVMNIEDVPRSTLRMYVRIAHLLKRIQPHLVTGGAGGMYGRTIIGPEGWQPTWAFVCRLTD